MVAHASTSTSDYIANALILVSYGCEKSLTLRSESLVHAKPMSGTLSGVWSLTVSVLLSHCRRRLHVPSSIVVTRVTAAAPGEIDPVTDSYDIDVVLKPPPSISLGG